MQRFFSSHRKFLITCAILIALDLLTKYLFFDLGRGAGMAHLQPAFNTGVSRSVPVPMLVTILIGRSSLILFVIMYYEKYISRYIAALLIAGTIGNLVDRMFLGGVRDFLLLASRFPIFNIADILLNVGILWYVKNFLVISSCKTSKKK